MGKFSATQVLQRCTQEPAQGKKRGKAKNAPKFDLRERLFKMCGVDLCVVARSARPHSQSPI